MDQNFTINDCASHVERVVQKPGCKEERDREGEISYGEVEADVKRVAAVLKNPFRDKVLLVNGREGALVCYRIVSC